MAWWWIEGSDIWLVAINADECAILIDRYQLLIEILSQPIFVVTFSTCGDRNVRLQASKRCGFRDVDMARRALRDVLLLLTAAVVNELRRDPLWSISHHEWGGGELVTSVAVRSHRILRFPMTVETRCVIGRNSFERRGPCSMTDSAVVVALRRVRETQQCNCILMFVVRKLDVELQLRSGIPKRVTRFIARGGLRMTHRTDRRLRTAEELRTVTTHTRVMIGVIGNVRK